MGAVVGCAIVAGWLLVAGGRAEGVPVPKLGEPSCEDKCRLDSERDTKSCEAQPLQEGARDQCRQATRARFDVCLRICDD